ncbi:MAG: amidohydrolase family protein, partial [Alphaproteobacteria bacterium]|nr:amidohydrolase family protein [Alphaproteobacteria bacterium]
MITRLAGGRVVAPPETEDETRDLWIEDGRIVAPPAGVKPDIVHDVADHVVMAGAIDVHSHIAGGKVNLARLLMAADHRDNPELRQDGFLRSGGGIATPSTFTTGYRYAAMGYTSVFEPAMVASNARATHLEMTDVPIVDKGAYVMLGNDEFLLRRLAAGAGQGEINDYVAWMMRATGAMAVKVVNPGGISAFKFGHRGLGIDDKTPVHDIAPRTIIRTLARAVHELGVPHP